MTLEGSTLEIGFPVVPRVRTNDAPRWPSGPDPGNL